MFGIFCDSFGTILGPRSAMLQLTKAGEYGAGDAAPRNTPSGQTALIGGISRTWESGNIPPEIVGKLTRRIAENNPRNGGGIALARPAREITLLDVIQVRKDHCR
jgi:hypothetical protein